MTKKIALFALAIASAAQADPSCDVTSRLYGVVGLGFSNAHAPRLKNKKLNHRLEDRYNGLSQAHRALIDPSKANITTSYKKARALATRLALGGQFLVPTTCLVLGAEMSFGLGGSKGQIKQNLDKTKIADAVAGRPGRAAVAAVAAVAERNVSGSYVCKIRDRWNLAFTGTVGAKVRRFLPYVKFGVAIHALKRTEEISTTMNGVTISESTITKKKRPCVVMGFGAEYNVTKNIIVGVEWTQHRGNLGSLNKAEKKVATKQEKKMDKIRTNEFMLMCKYAFPVN